MVIDFQYYRATGEIKEFSDFEREFFEEINCYETRLLEQEYQERLFYMEKQNHELEERLGTIETGLMLSLVVNIVVILILMFR